MNVTDSFFQQKPDIKPIIYAYELVGVESHKGYIKVGAWRDSAKHLFAMDDDEYEECLTLCAGFRVYRARHGEDFEARFTSRTENCYTTNQSQESICLTMLRNECCIGYWKAGYKKRTSRRRYVPGDAGDRAGAQGSQNSKE